jgi:hypothetical protein
MNIKYVTMASLATMANAEWGFGWTCPPVEKMEGLDESRFMGHWYEIFRDWDHDYWSDEECTQSYYDEGWFGTMELSRKFLYKSWFYDPYKPGRKGPYGIGPKWYGWWGDPNKEYISKGIWGGGTFEHMVIDTDYDNYAIVYGCDTYYFFFHGYYATLLSREPYVEYPYVRKAKDKLETIDYDYASYWVKSGLFCGFDAAKTLDEVMLTTFTTDPDWELYGP